MKCRIFALLLICLLLNACAASTNWYDYSNAGLDLPLKPTQNSIAVGVLDHRPYVVSGDKDPKFVGLQRGRYGIPYDVRTASTYAFADDIAHLIVRELRDYRDIEARSVSLDPMMQKDVAALLVTNGTADRSLLITLHEWKSDKFNNAKLFYDIEVEVLDTQSQVIAHNQLTGTKGLYPGGSRNAPGAEVLLEFSEMFQTLLLEPTIVEALHSGSPKAGKAVSSGAGILVGGRSLAQEFEKPKREVVLDPVVENPRPPPNEAEPEMLLAPVMVNPSLNPVAPLRITSEQRLLDLLSNATSSGKSERGTEFDVYSRQDGRMVARTARGNVDEGTWKIEEDGRYCRQWNKWRNATRDCYFVYELGNGHYRFKAIEKSYESIVRIARGDREQLKRRMSTAEGAPLRQVRIEDTGVAVAVAAAASVGATSGPDQMTAEGTSSQHESQPEYLRVALLPFTAKFPNSNGAIFLEPVLEEFSKKFLGRRSGLKLTYSYYQPELGGGPQLNPAMIWKGNLNKLPKKSEIYSIAEKIDADLALTFFHTLRTADWTAYDLYSVDVYLFDLAYERMYHGSGHERNYKEVTEHLFEQLVRDRQESTGKGT